MSLLRLPWLELATKAPAGWGVYGGETVSRKGGNPRADLGHREGIILRAVWLFPLLEGGLTEHAPCAVMQTAGEG